jgi:phosphate starvation-inducible PhoH-like protein
MKMSKRKTNYKNAQEHQSSQLVPKTRRQKTYIDALKYYEQVFVLGPAGTGKTYIAATFAADMFRTKQVDKIIITRPNVASGRSLGFSPGTQDEKMEEWLLPVLDTLRKHLGPNTVDNAVRNRNIEFAPLEKMRGRSFESAFIILDEAQNVSKDEIKMFLTRVGEGCKTVINGDIQQSDLKQTNGLSSAIRIAEENDINIPVIEFTVDDIVRSELCKQWIVAWMKEEAR